MGTSTVDPLLVQGGLVYDAGVGGLSSETFTGGWSAMSVGRDQMEDLLAPAGDPGPNTEHSYPATSVTSTGQIWLKRSSQLTSNPNAPIQIALNFARTVTSISFDAGTFAFYPNNSGNDLSIGRTRGTYTSDTFGGFVNCTLTMDAPPTYTKMDYFLTFNPQQQASATQFQPGLYNWAATATYTPPVVLPGPLKARPHTRRGHLTRR